MLQDQSCDENKSVSLVYDELERGRLLGKLLLQTKEALKIQTRWRWWKKGEMGTDSLRG